MKHTLNYSIRLLALDGSGFKTFHAGTEYQTKLGKVRGFTCEIWVIDGKQYTEV